MGAKYQFPVGKIWIQPSASNIGPFRFDLSSQLPDGDDIASVEVRASLGGDDTTSELISGTPTVANNVISVYFNYPGEAGHGDHKITFVYTLISGGRDEADFFRVIVMDC